MEIITNHQYRDILNYFDLTEKELKEFDYLDLDNGEGSFFRYRGQVYDLGEFQPAGQGELRDWSGFCSDSFFSGVAIKFNDDCDQVKVGLCLS